MQDPYRPHAPPPDPELARLAMQGQQRRAEIQAGQQVDPRLAGRHLRIAIGGYRGSTVKRCLLAVIVLGLGMGALGVVFMNLDRPDIGGFMIPGFALTFVTFMIWVFVPPIASQGAVAAEEMWAMALPFTMQGYFDVLSSEPRMGRKLVFEITWRDDARAPEPGLLHSVFCAVDPSAVLDDANARGARITSGVVSGATGIKMNGVRVYRNHRLPGHVHALVERVLLPLHRSHPIARIKLKG
jgi:hypothetical protein